MNKGEHIINTWFYVCSDAQEYSIRDFIDVIISNKTDVYRKRIEIEVIGINKLKKDLSK